MNAQPETQQTATVALGDHTMEVPKDGLYDRYRMDTPLDVVAEDPRVTDVDFFRSLSKTAVDSPIGTTLTPNFYYKVSTARVVYLARSRDIRRRIPGELDPLEVVPGIGLMSLMVFRYDVCDIDFYAEAAVAAVVRPARHGKVGVADLVSGLGNTHLHAHVLSLPVDTEIAYVRGHFGYGFPKWVTELDVDIDERRVAARVANDQGETDVSLSATTPRQKSHPSGARVGSLTSYTKTGGRWRSTLTQTNVLSAGSTTRPRGLSVKLGNGRVSEDFRSLGPIRPIQLEVATNSQIALHMPAPISVRDSA